MQEGGSQYEVPLPEMTLFAAAGTGTSPQLPGIPAGPQQPQQQPPPAETASPISSCPPMRTGNFDELAATASEGFPDEDALAAAGDEAERGGVSTNRWPREGTLALLRIRSEMDAAFRDTTLKGPLWEDVSRKLTELGYKRSAKKCKEKFENVHKYYKRTKDGRAGRQDGKGYRFFSQLEALHSSSGGNTTAAAATATLPASTTAASTPNPVPSMGMLGSSERLQPTPLNAIPLSGGTARHVLPEAMAGTTTTPAVSYPSGGISFSSNNSSSASESGEEDTEECLPEESRKRRRSCAGGGGVGSSEKMMAFFDGLMKQVIEKQEAMQQKFLEMIEKREQDRMIREEAWRRQEMARVRHENEMMAKGREISASRDAAIIAFLQKMTGQIVPVPPSIPAVAPAHPVSQKESPPALVPSASPPPRQPQPPQLQEQLQPHGIHRQGTEIVRTQAAPLDMVPLTTEAQEVAGAGGGSSMDPASSRWPKSEVHALIKLRSGMESRYLEAGPKGPLWEEIAAGMRRMGYSRNAKRCKEKWENINKYFKKVKESNKKRPEDAKTCPYFHQLDALYQKKILGAGSSLGNRLTKQGLESTPTAAAVSQPDVSAAPPPKLALPEQTQMEAEGKNNGGGGGGGGGGNNNGHRNDSNPDGNGVPTQRVQTRNDAHAPNFLEEGADSDENIKEPEDIAIGLMLQQRQQQHATMCEFDKTEQNDSDSIDQEDDTEDGAVDEKKKMAYQMEYQQKPGVKGTPNGGGNPSAAAATAGSFMAMVQ